MKKLFLFLAAIVILASCQTKETAITLEEQQGIAAKIKANVQLMVDSLGVNNEKNFDRQMDSWVNTEDKAWVGEPAFWLNMLYLLPDKESIAKTWNPDRQTRQSTNFKIEKDYVAVMSKESALYVFTGTYSMTDSDGVTGADIPLSGTMVFVLRDGEWKTLHIHYSWEQ